MQTYIITGASSGIGQQVARDLAHQGQYQLVISARRKERLEALAYEIESTTQSKVFVYPADLSKSQEIEGLVNTTVDQFGRIDGLVACAGYGDFKPAIDFTYYQMMEMFELNTLSTMYLSNLVGQIMVDQGFGHISMIASVAGKIASPLSSVYSASKFAIIGYANSLRLELRKAGISVTVVNPGPVKTDFFAYSDQLKNYFQTIQNFAISSQTLSRKIIKNIQAKRPKREITCPFYFEWMNKLYVLFPEIGDFLAGDVLNFKED